MQFSAQRLGLASALTRTKRRHRRRHRRSLALASTRPDNRHGAAVTVVCRRFYYEPIITPPPRRVSHRYQYALHEQERGAHVNREERDRSRTAVNRLPCTIVTKTRPWTFDFAKKKIKKFQNPICYFYLPSTSLSTTIREFYITVVRPHKIKTQ